MEQASTELEKLSKGDGYKDLLVKLILQVRYFALLLRARFGFLLSKSVQKLEGEPEILVRCREEDRDVAAQAVEIAKETREKAGAPVKLVLDLKNYLAPSREKAGPKTLSTW